MKNGSETNTLIKLRGISKSFDGEQILCGIDLDIHDKEFVTLLGPSGCGKTTTLRIIGGFETPDAGEVTFDGKRINDLPPYRRQVNTVFQRYALFPHLNVYENVAFGLRLKNAQAKKKAFPAQVCEMAKSLIGLNAKKAREEEEAIREQVQSMLKMVNLKGFEKRHISTLSGGQQQRVAIARALINKPRVLLLDEPLGALDLKLRKDMQKELRGIQQQTGITFIYVTHDQEEALTMSDTIVVMADGKIQQIGTPTDIYNEPENAFVADFIGESNIVDGVMLEDNKVRFARHTFECVDGGFRKNEPVDVVVRPEDVDVVPVEKGMCQGTVTSVTFKGDYYEIIVDVDGFKWMLETSDFVAENTLIGLFIEPEAIHVMKKSEYSGMFGDYSTFSDEMDHLGDPEEEVEE